MGEIIQTSQREFHVRWTQTVGSKGSRSVLVFLHSLGADLHLWQGVIDAWSVLSSGPRDEASERSDVGLLSPDLLQVDLPGHGESQVGTAPYRIEELADSLAELLAGVDSTHLTVCGISVGGQIAQAWAGRHPTQVSALCLAATAPTIGTPAGWQARIDAVRAGGLAAVAEPVLERWFGADFHKSHPAVVARCRAALLQTSEAGYVTMLHALRDADLSAQLPRIQQPTLVLAGEQDTATPPELVRELAERLPRAQFKILPNAGHTLCLEQPQAFAERLHSFLKSVAKQRLNREGNEQ